MQNLGLKIVQYSILTNLIFGINFTFAETLTKPGRSTIEYLDEMPVSSTKLETLPIAKDVPAAKNLDKRDALLALPERQGYGSNATGGLNYINVSSFSELKSALETENAYVILDASLTDKEIGFTSQIRPAKNTTLDGSDAPGAILFPDYDSGYPANTTMFSINDRDNTGNSIFYNIRIDGRRSITYTSSHPSYNTGVFIIRTGRDYWFHKIEITNFWDDAFSSGRLADYITFSNMRIKNTDKAILLFYPDTASHGNGHVSIFNSDLSAAGRNPLNTGGEFLHVWNSYIHDWNWLGNAVGYRGTNSTTRTTDARTISENNYYQGGNSDLAERAFSFRNYPDIIKINGWMYSNGSIFIENKREDTQNVVQSDNSDSYPFTIPYDYTLRDSLSVKEYVLKHAGPDQ